MTGIPLMNREGLFPPGGLIVPGRNPRVAAAGRSGRRVPVPAGTPAKTRLRGAIDSDAT